jgi:hypothetical protein
MEVSNLPMALTTGKDLTSPSTTAHSVLDVDMDIDLGPEVPVEEAIVEDLEIEATNNEGMLAILSEPELNQSVPHKVHLRGLDNLTTGDINEFAAEHFPSNLPTRIEWIDDTSANLIYGTQALAEEALTRFSIIPDMGSSALPLLHTRPAKPFTSHPGSSLHVRMAVFSDRKQPRAYEASRFYLMHPELDPREKKKRQGRGDDHGDYRRRRYDKSEQRRRRYADEGGTYHASMYDDDHNSSLTGQDDAHAARRGSLSSRSSQDDHGRKHYRRMRYSRSSRSRDRSASPVREGNEDRNLVPENNRASRREDRERVPLSRSRLGASSSAALENGSKELFPYDAPSQAGNSAVLRGFSRAAPGRELFPTKTASTSLKKLVFPNKTGISNHRRSDAFDAADETADLFANGMSVPFTDGALDRRSVPRNLEDRISKPLDLTYGRLKESDSAPSAATSVAVASEGFSIRGVARIQDQGFSIRGTAGNSSTNQDIKELFPGKYGGNFGKELFSEKLEGRGGQRRRAEDMFY